MVSETLVYKSQCISKYSRESFFLLKGNSAIRFSYWNDDSEKFKGFRKYGGFDYIPSHIKVFLENEYDSCIHTARNAKVTSTRIVYEKTLMERKVFRGVFRTHSKIYNEAFLVTIVSSLWTRCSIKKIICERSHWCDISLPLFAYVPIFMVLTGLFNFCRFFQPWLFCSHGKNRAWLFQIQVQFVEDAKHSLSSQQSQINLTNPKLLFCCSWSLVTNQFFLIEFHSMQG